MRIAFLTLDGLASSRSSQEFIARHKDEIVFVALSPPFRPEAGGMIGQSWRHLKRSGILFSYFLACNFSLPRLAAHVHPKHRTIMGQCSAAGIPCEAVADVNGDAFRKRLASLEVDLVVISFFDQILKPETLAIPRLGTINVHIAPLPRHRGPMPVIYGLLDDPNELGVTVHRVEAGIDTGPILAMTRYEAEQGKSVLTIIRELQAAGLGLVDRVLDDIKSGRVREEVQGSGSYEGFPTRATLRALRSRERRLFDTKDIRLALKTPAYP